MTPETKLPKVGTTIFSVMSALAARHGAELGLLLRIEAGGQCSDDAELIRARERLAGLYAERASLACSEPQPKLSEFVLRVPL